MMKTWISCVGIGAILASAGLWAASPQSVAELASGLAASRDACAQQAKQVADTAALANYQATLDLQNAQLKAQMDAQVYAVGHGGRETTRYLADRLQESSSASEQTTRGITDKLATGSQAVNACVARAQEQRKIDYSAFKADKRHRADMPEAQSLMTAWLTNVAEISTDSPQGSDESLAAWKAAKAHVEVSAL